MNPNVNSVHICISLCNSTLLINTSIRLFYFNVLQVHQRNRCVKEIPCKEDVPNWEENLKLGPAVDRRRRKCWRNFDILQKYLVLCLKRLPFGICFLIHCGWNKICIKTCLKFGEIGVTILLRQNMVI